MVQDRPAQPHERKRLGIFPGNTEFVFGLAGGNLFMRARIDIRIDPECHLAVLPSRLQLAASWSSSQDFRH